MKLIHTVRGVGFMLREEQSVRRWWRSHSLRTSLTLWYVAAMIIVLGALCHGRLSCSCSRNLSEALDERLRGDFQWAARMAEERPDGSSDLVRAADTGDDDPPWLQVWAPNGTLLFRTSSAAAQPCVHEPRLVADRHDGRVARGAGRPTTFRLLPAGPRGSPESRSSSRWRARKRRCGGSCKRLRPDADPRPAARGRGRGVRRLFAGPPRAGADRAHDGARPDHQRRPPERSPAGRKRPTTSSDGSRRCSTRRWDGSRRRSSRCAGSRPTSRIELRTPLTAIRSVGEVGLREPRDEVRYRAIIGSMLEEVDRLSDFVNRLLALSRAENNRAKPPAERMDLAALAGDVVAHLSVLAEEKRQSLVIQSEGPAEAIGDRTMVRQALINVVDNAIKYTPDGGAIRIRLSATPRLRHSRRHRRWARCGSGVRRETSSSASTAAVGRAPREERGWACR